MTAGPEGGLPTAAFDYALPPELIARYPVERRDESRLLVLHRSSGAVEHRVFRDLAELIPPGDALVLNETRVFPARLVGRKPTGAPGEVLLLRPWGGGTAEGGPTGGDTPVPAAPEGEPAAGREPVRSDAAAGAEGGPGSGPVAPSEAGPIGAGRLWEALVRPGGKLKPGRVLEVAEDLTVEIVDSVSGGGRIVRLRSPGPAAEAIERHGRVPLPPYLAREPEPLDRQRYQTVYAREPGSVAAPTAGLHFTPALLRTLEERGVVPVRLVLHVGLGTFRPVEAEDPAEHPMHAEWYRVGEEAAATLNAVREAGGSLWAVGTTVVRTLETVADPRGRVRPGAGWTDIFIRPPFVFRAVDRLVTNFHLPRSTLLMLVAAFGGHARVMGAYREAVARRYRFYSYGDAMAVL